MTYCVALNLNEGLVLLADSRTNAGIDNISTFSKMFTWTVPSGTDHSRAIALMTAGNLSITQEIIGLINEENNFNAEHSILRAPSLFRVTERVGQLMSEVQARRGPNLHASGVSAGASIIVAGQVVGEPTRLFMVYTEGNFIEATDDTPFMQIGEFKYGKPILDRTVDPSLPLQDGVKAALLSMDATMRSNLSVGMPVDLAVLTAGNTDWVQRRFTRDDTVFQELSETWSEHLRTGFQAMPPVPL